MKRLVFLLALSLPSVALAEPGDRRTRRAVDTELADRAAMEEAAKVAASQSRHREMEAAEQLLHNNRSLSSDQRADLMLRLADLYFREGRAAYLDEMLEYQRRFDACFNDSACDPESLVADHSGSKAWHDKSIRLYGIILDNYPKFPRADEATYYLASALSDLDRSDEALRAYIDLVKHYPQSDLVPAAYLQIGEAQFDKGEVFKATLAYKKASAYRHHEYYALSLYKLSWCYYNLGEYGLALDTIKRVIVWSDDTLDAEADVGTYDLREDAYRDLVRFCADGGDLDECVHFITERGREDLVRETMVRLGATYLEQGKDEDARVLYKRLIASAPKDVEAGGYQAEIVAISRKMGRVDETVTELDRLLRDYGSRSAWAQANAADADEVSALQARAAKDLADIAVGWHGEARKLGTGPRATELYDASDRLYGVYRSEFADGPHLYDVTFAHAELLFARKAYEPAWEAYTAVVDMDPSGKHGMFSAEAAIHAAAALAGEPDEATGTAPIPLDEWEQRHLGSLTRYAAQYPDGPKVQFAEFKAAWLLYHHNEFAQAAERFQVVIARDPTSQEAMYAANLILDSLALVEDWGTLRSTSRAFHEQADLGGPAFKEDVWEIHERASFQLVESQRLESGDDLQAARDLLAFVEEFPASRVGDLALNNAAVWLAEGGERARATDVRLTLLERYPESEHVVDATLALAVEYEAMGQFDRSASFYERFAASYPEHEGAPAALYSAALFREAMGEPEAALRDTKHLLKLAEDREDHGELLLRKARLQVATQDVEGADATLQMLLREDVGGDLKMVVWQERVSLDGDRLGAALAWADQAEGLGAVAREIAAGFRFAEVEPVWQAYAALRIDGPDQPVSQARENRLLADQFRNKTEALADLEGRYARVIETGSGPWGVASLVRVGEAYEDLAETLVTSHVPSFLTPEQAEMYRQDLNDRATLMRLKAQTAYETAHTKAIELDVYDASNARALERLRVLDPEAWPHRAESLPEPSFPSGVTRSAPFELSLAALGDRDASIENDLGVAAWQAGDAVEAQAAFHRALTLDPAHPAASLNLGLLALAAGDPRSAEPPLARVWEASGRRDAGLALAQARSQGGQDPGPVYAALLALDPQDWAAAEGLALHAGRTGDWPRGLATLEAYLAASSAPDPDAFALRDRLNAEAQAEAEERRLMERFREREVEQEQAYEEWLQE